MSDTAKVTRINKDKDWDLGAQTPTSRVSLDVSGLVEGPRGC